VFLIVLSLILIVLIVLSVHTVYILLYKDTCQCL